MRLGYSYWGFLGDVKLDWKGNTLSTPDGNATYSWAILYEAIQRGWSTYRMMPDRDQNANIHIGLNDMFSSFSKMKRTTAYLETRDEDFPELDVLLLEWRFPIPGRNIGIDKEDPNYQPDFHIQNQLLNHYAGTKTRVIFWDLDHKLTFDDEREWAPDAIFETSVSPRQLLYQRTRVEPPTIVADLMQHPTLPADKNRKMVYVGSRYERDDVIEEFLAPVASHYPGQIEFWGNWTRKENLDECMQKWPHFSYNGRITTRDFRRVYETAVSCPLLAKRSYIETGFITPRPWEALLFGTIPLGITQMKGIHDYVHWSGKCAEEFDEYVELLSKLSMKERDNIRRRNIEQIEFMDVKHFVDRIEEVVDGNNCRRPV